MFDFKIAQDFKKLLSPPAFLPVSFPFLSCLLNSKAEAFESDKNWKRTDPSVLQSQGNPMSKMQARTERVWGKELGWDPACFQIPGHHCKEEEDMMQ